MDFFSNIVKIMQKYWQVFLVQGISYTLLLSLLTVAFGAVLGLLLYLGRTVRFKPLNWLCIAIVEVIRGTPMLLQLYVGYFIVPKILPFQVTEFTSVAVALCINSGCYVSEIFRSGIQAVDKGQTEAARSLGLNSRQTMFRIILPQAIKNILPGLHFLRGRADDRLSEGPGKHLPGHGVHDDRGRDLFRAHLHSEQAARFL